MAQVTWQMSAHDPRKALPLKLSRPGQQFSRGPDWANWTFDDSRGSAIDQNRVGRATSVAHVTLPEDSGRQSSSEDERDTTERGVADGLTKPAVQQCATGFGTQENSSLPVA